MPTIQAKAQRLAHRTRLARWLGRGLETHIALPVFALLLVAAMWLLTLRLVDSEHEAAAVAARTATQERLDTYEAQMARSLNGIDQTLKVLKYAVEMKGTQGAIPALREQGLLPPGLVFVVAVADRSGRIVASNPDEGALDVSNAAYFLYHRDNDEGEPFVSATVADPVKAEPHLHFTRRINDAAGRFAGIAIVEVEPAYFTSAYEHARDGEHGMLGLAGLDGVMRALRIGDTISWGQRIELGRGAQGATHGSIALRQGTPDGVARYTAIQRLHGFPLAIVVGLAQDEQFAPYEATRRTWLLVAGGASALLLLVVAVISMWSWQLAKARRRAHRAQETYAAASEGSLDAFCVFRTVRDARGRVDDFEIEATNSKAEEIFGMTSAELHGKRLCSLLPHYRANGIFDDMAEVVHTGQAREGEWQASAVAAVGRWLHRQVVPVEDGLVVIVRDITERKLAEERIFHMAHHDELTGLPNRNLMHDRIDQAIRNAARGGTGVALAFVDLDGFKLVNDGLGHKAGDELLKVVSRRMGACLRRNDTLARFGGDEFVILLPDQAHDPLALTPLLEKIRMAVTEQVEVAGQAVQVSCSMGVVMYPRDGADASALLMNADAAMYRAKDLGSNNFQFYAREMNASVEEKLMLLDGLRHAVQETVEGDGAGAGKTGNRFHLLYQPKVDLKTGRIFGVEALIRWHHPEHGVVSPQRFIGLAEESGLIVQIGEWVVRTACRQARTWLACGLPPITVSVNVSARQFEESRLVERVAAALQDSGLPPELLELEVTESLIMRDLQKAVDKMRELKAMGVSLSVDDFGTGYSSLSALKSFPISRLKIDKSFVSELAENPDDQAIAMAVISLGHKLNLKVIAEGVETEQQCAFLRANECDEMQGYLFSKPVTAGEIEDMVEQYIAKPGSCAKLSLVASQPQAALALAS
ncbi:EAL domain-containing protein [Massilia sp. YIM B02769]|uniref:bifunctional diguanylate cyclase/phosphodiesterase n=1 Tax=Massilia sp. YIM B02769 TaxID=3050129 RepID=UPI0025B65042|nr:EAL domain-containing protein [Massilia sp. YIM B02769]MDN4060129.1 EAL domain-containing protein [Massilia sp. YIM B02769]